MTGEELRKILDKAGTDAEKDMTDFGLNDWELQIVETTIATMKSRAYEKLMRKF